jgi:transcriptional regulator, tetR family
MLKHLATADEYEPVVRYLAMCLRTGGDLARRVVEQMIADAEQSLAQQVEHGIIVESADPKARARYVTLSQVGALVMEFAMAEPGTTSMEIWQNHVATTMLPALELYSHGMLTDNGAMLEEYKKSLSGQSATAQ